MGGGIGRMRIGVEWIVVRNVNRRRRKRAVWRTEEEEVMTTAGVLVTVEGRPQIVP
jgi:hypothetical protein